jgi:general secretion pathway protein A
MLDSHELRQLGQRITLSCHLTPLTYRETKEYIKHRIQVASQKPEVKFAGGAYRAIYKYSGGIPRLINIACDRALLTAFGLNRKRVTGIIAKASIRELAGRGDTRRTSLREGRKMPVSFGVLLGVFLAILYLGTVFLIIHRSVDMRVSTMLQAEDLQRPKVTQKVGSGRQEAAEPSSGQASALPPRAEGPFREPSGSNAAEVLETSGSEHKQPGKGKALPPFSGDPHDFLVSTDSRSSRVDALNGVLDSWPGELELSASLNDMDDDQAFFRIATRQKGLQVLRVTADLDLLRKLNLPAILELRLPGSPSPRYAALVRIQEETLVFSEPERGYVQWDYGQINPYWSGAAYIPWKDFLGYDRIIQYGSSSDAVVSLKTFLRDLGYEGIQIGPAYDEKTIMVVKGVQAKHGIPTDGLVGPLTKIVLYNEHGSLSIPHLVESP